MNSLNSKQKMGKNHRHKKGGKFNKKQVTEFMRDFDLLTQVKQEEKILYEQADIDQANEMVRKTYVLRQDGEKYNFCCDLEQFRKFGPGIYLLFKLLKYSTIAFGIISMFAIISMAILATGEDDNNHHSDGFKNFLIKTTLQHINNKNEAAILGLSFVIILLLTIGLIIWKQKQSQYIIDCLKETSLSSYFTVILKQIPTGYTEGKIEMHLSEKYGEIEQVYTVREFGDDMLYYKEMNEILGEYKEEKALINLDKTIRSNRICGLFFEFKNGHLKMKEKIKKSENYKPCFAFIRFKKIQDREKLLQENSSMFPCFSTIKGSLSHSDHDHDPEINNERVNAWPDCQLMFEQCAMQPAGIIWENIHISKSAKVGKIFIMICLMIGVLILSIFLIFLLSTISMGVSNSRYSDYTLQQIFETNDSFAIWFYCMNLPPNSFYSEDACGGLGSDYVRIAILALFLPLSVSLLKFIMSQLMKGLVSFRRYGYQISKIQSQATILFIFFFLVTGVLQLVIYLGSDSSSLLSYFEPTLQKVIHPQFSISKIKLVDDFTPTWYYVASKNIILIGAVSFNLSAVGIIMYCLLRRWVFRKISMRQKIMIHMKKWLEGYELEIEYIYASILTIICFTLLIGSAMPILYPLAFLSLLIQYLCYKLTFIKFCKKPLTFNHSINRKATNLLFVAIIVHCIVTPVFFHSPGILSQEKMSFFQRIFNLWHYPLLVCFIIAYMLFRNPLIAFFRKLRAKNQNKQEKQEERNVQVVRETNQTHQSQIESNEKKRHSFQLPTLVRKIQNQSTQEPYSMHENEQYRNILKILYTINSKERTRKTCFLNKQLFEMYEKKAKVEKDESKSRINFRELFEVIRAVRRDYHEYQKKNRQKLYKKKDRNPFQANKRKLYELLLHVRHLSNKRYTINHQNTHQIYQVLKQNGFSVEGFDGQEGTTTREAFFSNPHDLQKIEEDSDEENKEESQEGEESQQSPSSDTDKQKGNEENEMPQSGKNLKT